MKTKESETMKPSKVYAEVLEQSALDQFEDAMAQPFVVSGALMPDAHKGYSLPIGAVVATEGKIVPAWVGYDSGCGVCALKLDKSVTVDAVKENAQDIFNGIYDYVPVGFKKNALEGEYDLTGLTPQGQEIAVAKQYRKALGTLGGGNHFAEVGSDEEGNVWIVVHSGSRGVGHGIASWYMTLAAMESKEELEALAVAAFEEGHMGMLGTVSQAKYAEVKARFVTKHVAKAVQGTKAREGHHAFDVDSEDGRDYIQDLAWCLDYAVANRKEIVSRIAEVIMAEIGVEGEVDFTDLINRNHNHAVLKDGLWIHRKGATHAEEGMMGAIPGNMRDGTFIVRGKGNKDALESSSHGAGRVLGRKAAKRELNMEDFTNTMEGVTALVKEDTLDESPEAYKDIFEVMRLQEDLVDVVAHVKPIINIKG